MSYKPKPPPKPPDLRRLAARVYSRLSIKDVRLHLNGSAEDPVVTALLEAVLAEQERLRTILTKVLAYKVDVATMDLISRQLDDLVGWEPRNVA